MQTAYTAALALIQGVAIEDAPVWKTSAGAAISGGRLSVTIPAQGVTPWTHTLRAVNPASGVASKQPADLGAVTLDEPADAPEGWTVTSAPRPAPAVHERDVTITAPETPAPGTHDLTLVARNACGPRSFVVAITVPAPPATEE